MNAPGYLFLYEKGSSQRFLTLTGLLSHLEVYMVKGSPNLLTLTLKSSFVCYLFILDKDLLCNPGP